MLCGKRHAKMVPQDPFAEPELISGINSETNYCRGWSRIRGLRPEWPTSLDAIGRSVFVVCRQLVSTSLVCIMPCGGFRLRKKTENSTWFKIQTFKTCFSCASRWCCSSTSSNNTSHGGVDDFPRFICGNSSTWEDVVDLLVIFLLMFFRCTSWGNPQWPMYWTYREGSRACM